jgi:hypothetical protein
LPDCPKCGALIREGSNFCSTCGTSLREEHLDATPDPRSVSSPNREIMLKHHKPGLAEMFFFFISGMIMSSPFTILAENLSVSLVRAVPQLYAVLVSVAVIGPLIEEFAKSYPLLYRHGETERSIFTLAFLTGLGFGILEFLLYVFVYSAPLIVRLPGVLFHATSTSISAYGIAVKRYAHYFLIAVFLHFFANFSSFFYSSWIGTAGYALALMICYYLSWRLYGQTGENIVD